MKTSLFISSCLAATLVLTACGPDHKTENKRNLAPRSQVTPKLPLVDNLTHANFSEYDQTKSCDALLEYIKGYTTQFAPEATLSETECRLEIWPATVEYHLSFKVQKGSVALDLKGRVVEGASGLRQVRINQTAELLGQISEPYAKLKPAMQAFVDDEGSPVVLGLAYDDFIAKAKPAMQEQGFQVSVPGTLAPYAVLFTFDDKDDEGQATEGTVTFDKVPKQVLESEAGLLGCKEEACLKDGSFEYRFLRNTFTVSRSEGSRKLLLSHTLTTPEQIVLKPAAQ